MFYRNWMIETQEKIVTASNSNNNQKSQVYFIFSPLMEIFHSGKVAAFRFNLLIFLTKGYFREVN